MKKLIFALIVLLFVTGTSAASIDVQETIPANTVWSFSVTLPNGADFDNADVLLNGNKIASFYTYNNNIKFDEKDIDKTTVFSSTEPVGNSVYFLVSPLGDGDYDILLEVDGSTADEQTVNFFEIYDADTQGDLHSRLDSLRGTMKSVVDQVNGFEERLSAALTEEDRQALQANIDSLQSSMSEIETGLKEQDADNLTKIIALNDYLNDSEIRTNEDKATPATGVGMVSLGSVGPEAQTGILFIIVAIVTVVLVVKFKDKIPKKGLYSTSKKQQSVFSQHDEDIADQVMTESQDEVKSGKWAIEGAKPVGKTERKRFNVGDLLRKD